MRQAKQSVEARQRDIYDSHRHRTFAVAYYMTGNELEAEQILTRTFIRAFGAVQDPGRDEVDSALIAELRQRLHLTPENSADAYAENAATAADPCEATPDLSGRNVKRTDLEEAIQQLPPVERLLFLLRDVEGYTAAAIAKLIDMPEPQVSRTLFSARLRMRKLLAEGQSEIEKAA
jgi:RNA polymerase sigma-70 factor (ECF subfamily)